MKYVSFAEYLQIKDIKGYQKYKKGECDEQVNEVDMRILSLLEKLGYPMEKIGTYLYKELIRYIYDNINDYMGSEDKCQKLLDELAQPYSGLYIGVASDYLEVGTKSFHRYVREALAEVDSSKNKQPISIEVRGLEENNIDYGIQAMVLATYIYGKRDKKEEKVKVKEKVKEISECV